MMIGIKSLPFILNETFPPAIPSSKQFLINSNYRKRTDWYIFIGIACKGSRNGTFHFWWLLCAFLNLLIVNMYRLAYNHRIDSKYLQECQKKSNNKQPI